MEFHLDNDECTSHECEMSAFEGWGNLRQNSSEIPFTRGPEATYGQVPGIPLGQKQSSNRRPFPIGWLGLKHADSPFTHHHHHLQAP
jgi:hypothetical protein